jgi:dipeptidyl aminopeptidase/acylaminoacyl peptidase
MIPARHRRPTVRIRYPLLVLVLLLAPALGAQEPYQQPPEIVRRILDAPRPPILSPSPDAKLLLVAQPSGQPTIADLAKPMLRLAGHRLNPETNGARLLVWFTGLTLHNVGTGADQPVTIPQSPRLSRPDWSPDGKHIAFTQTTGRGVELWIADPATGAAQAATPATLNGTLGAPCAWMPSSAELLCRFVPADRGAPPEAPRVPIGPIVQQNLGKTAPVRTYEDLLTSPLDEALFDYYATSQLMLVSVAGGQPQPVGAPGIFLDGDPSPDGQYLLVTRATRPFSYQVPVEEFPQEIEVWSLDGRKVATLASLPSGENAPADGVRSGPRSVEWVSGRPATLFYVEALDGGDNRRRADVRDRALMADAPFTQPVELARLAYRFSGRGFGGGGPAYGRSGLLLLTEADRRARRVRTWRLDLTQPGKPGAVVWDRSSEDSYGNPGQPVEVADAAGRAVLLQSADGKWIYLRGNGASPTGEHPFLDRVNLDSKKSERLFQSADSVYESVAAVLDNAGRTIVTRKESSTSPPNFVLRNLGTKTSVAITHVANVAPELATVKRELITYPRGDGVQLSGTLYYPINYREGAKVPVIFWVYPREFGSADAASQVVGSANRYVLPTGASQYFLLTQGYAVLDNPTLPVVGGDTANNSYVQQTVAGAKAAIDFLLAKGIANGSFGVGGHSYGAFTTANLLAHSDLFKAGVARSGAYNRTLTPFGFQNEQRTYWEAKDVYDRMMPFAFADSINEPILLIHGMADDNSGTFPIQSERMYAALKGFGATVEYVQLPFEAHGYAGRETVMDVVARMIEWYDRYVKAGAAATFP